MSKFTDRVFALRSAYSFGRQPEQTLEDYRLSELAYQLKDLEDRWLRIQVSQLDANRSFKEEMHYQREFERVVFRLEEILRFVDKNAGPTIIRFVCSEILDLMRDKQFMEKDLIPAEVDWVGIILVVMNSYFQPEIAELGLMTVEEIARKLKEATTTLIDHSF